MINRINRQAIRRKKHKRMRKNIFGTADRPRMAVFRSLNHIYAQLINDEQGVTLVAASSLVQILKRVPKMAENSRRRKDGDYLPESTGEEHQTSFFDRGGNLILENCALAQSSLKQVLNSRTG